METMKTNRFYSQLHLKKSSARLPYRESLTSFEWSAADWMFRLGWSCCCRALTLVVVSHPKHSLPRSPYPSIKHRHDEYDIMRSTWNSDNKHRPPQLLMSPFYRSSKVVEYWGLVGIQHFRNLQKWLYRHMTMQHMKLAAILVDCCKSGEIVHLAACDIFSNIHQGNSFARLII